ncbi:hypothetical protein LINPERHAP1_LOCUS20831 [Linum perenne]
MRPIWVLVLSCGLSFGASLMGRGLPGIRVLGNSIFRLIPGRCCYS